MPNILNIGDVNKQTIIIEAYPEVLLLKKVNIPPNNIKTADIRYVLSSIFKKRWLIYLVLTGEQLI